jgi:hypothetical protein
MRIRIDEKLVFKSIEVAGKIQLGPWKIRRTVGDLGYAGRLVVVNDETGVVYPWERVESLVTDTISPSSEVTG